MGKLVTFYHGALSDTYEKQAREHGYTKGDVTAGDLYQHYKGGIYEILAEAKHTETQEELIVYRSLETGKTWVRPKAMFFGKTDDGRPRFAKVITRLEKVLCDKKAMSDLLIEENCPHHFGLEDYETAGNHGCMGVKCKDCWNERAEEHDKT